MVDVVRFTFQIFPWIMEMETTSLIASELTVHDINSHICR